MKIKRGKEPKPPVMPDTPIAGDAPQTRFVSKSAGRILVAVTQKGTIDFARMNRDARKQLVDLLANDEVQKQLGFGPPMATFDPEQCKRLYDAVGRVYVTLGKYLLKFPDAAQQELLYTDAEKNELGPATAKMLDSYAPVWLAKHQAFAAWALVFAAITQEKFSRANEVAQAEKLHAHSDRRPDVFTPDTPAVEQ
jgi:hypothetical protein